MIFAKSYGKLTLNLPFSCRFLKFMCKWYEFIIWIKFWTTKIGGTINFKTIKYDAFAKIFSDCHKIRVSQYPAIFRHAKKRLSTIGGKIMHYSWEQENKVFVIDVPCIRARHWEFLRNSILSYDIRDFLVTDKISNREKNN